MINSDYYNPTDESKENLDLEKLLASADINSSIIELDNFICLICQWGEKIEILTYEQQQFYFIQNLEREVNNGGFEQYFVNSSGDFAHETLEALKIVGALLTATLLQIAIDEFPNQNVPKDRNERIDFIINLSEKTSEVWEKLDQKFFAYEDDLNTLNIEYVRKNRHSF
jgi:Domain of unknown function (DUF4375)